MIATIRASEIKRGDVIVDGKRRIAVSNITLGDSCDGIHINEVRDGAFVKHKGKWIPNVLANTLRYSDGCWIRCAFVTVVRDHD